LPDSFTDRSEPFAVRLPHLFFRQTFGFGGEEEELEADQVQLREKVDISRLTSTIGRPTTGDHSRRVAQN
jgi:hypothetical protein